MAAYAYDRAAYKLRGEYARLNFPNLSYRTGFIGDERKMEALRVAVDNKIEAICQKVKKEKAKKRLEKERGKMVRNGNCTESCSGSDVGSLSGSEDGVWKGGDCCSVSGEVTVAEEAEMETETETGGWLAEMPSYDLDLIWEILAN
ncbi:hypothetical protein L1987_67933 [Smallanthus sonchifolius]|uniref:Uncharacterized protein n=1 Tax=Smallanthus sonchifolius TaxID=185202 RepID=A0ACB9B2R2_9ASTR|nr:hypothetical protein L1987_67933 [Smallanthus sonchifolius]